MSERLIATERRKPVGTTASAVLTTSGDVRADSTPTATEQTGAPIGEDSPVEASSDLTRLWHEHYAVLVRLAQMLVDDRETAEEVVQDAFVRMHARLHRVAPETAPAYLRVAVLNGARSRLRRRGTARRHPASGPMNAPAAEHEAVAATRRAELLLVLRSLPRRQCEVVVLRYLADFSIADTASTLGISPGAVKTHAHRALTTLKPLLEDDR